jgi:carbon monoxide dehydrogenase subunit G
MLGFGRNHRNDSRAEERPMAQPSLWTALALIGLCAASAGAMASARESPPVVEVDADNHGASGDIRAQVDIAAPPATVWKVLIDCGQVPHLMVGAKSCRVLQHDPAGRWDVREQVSQGALLPAIRTVLRSDYDAPKTVHFHRIDGDLKVLEGSWRLDPLDSGLRTRVSYESRVQAPFGIPAFLARTVLRGDMPKTMNNLRNACEAAQARMASAH